MSNLHTKKHWAIVGAGRVGKTLGLLANSLGIIVDSTWNRRAESARRAATLIDPTHTYHAELAQVASRLVAGVDVVWITVIDAEIERAARCIAPFLVADQIVLHTAGSLGSGVLKEAGVPGPVASLHPLQSITDPEAALKTLSSCAWTVEGDPAALDFARALMGEVGVSPLQIDSDKKTLYHASAVTAANLLVALIDAAYQIAESAGMSREQARSMMLPLAASCIENLAAQDTPQALTGPAARGDQATIERHIQALKTLQDPALLELYQLLTARAQALAGRPSQQK